MSSLLNADVNRASELTSEIKKMVRDMFEYHPWAPEQEEKGKKVREVLMYAVEAIIENVPPCADRTVAIRKIREARMDVNSAISFGGRF